MGTPEWNAAGRVVKAGSFARVKANAINRSANVDHELRKRCKSSAC
jgi:hypothetical protein